MLLDVLLLLSLIVAVVAIPIAVEYDKRLNSRRAEMFNAWMDELTSDKGTWS